MGNTITIDEFTEAVFDDVPGVQAASGRRHTLRALVEFCERTHIWQEALDDIYYVEGVTEYELSPPSANESVICAIRSVKQGNILFRQSIDYTYNEPTLTFLRSHKDGTTFSVKAAIRPAQTATKVPSKLYTRWFFPISCRAKNLLLETPLGKFRDAEASARQQRDFEIGVGEAKRVVLTNDTSGPIRAEFPRV